ncbi:MAG TPA: hypothetical protein VK360_07445 [Acidimicrobiales bacterium]|nr:hypothetical protein [Acidimicrobiales bacterium]
MLKRRPDVTGRMKVTFALPDGGEHVSVVRDFNGWDPWVTPLGERAPPHPEDRFSVDAPAPGDRAPLGPGADAAGRSANSRASPGMLHHHG